MNENAIWKLVGLVAGVAFLAGAGLIVGLANMMGWWA